MANFLKRMMNWLVALCGICSAAAHAQSYPSRAIRIIVPFGQGGGMEKREPGLVAALKKQGLWAGGE